MDKSASPQIRSSPTPPLLQAHWESLNPSPVLVTLSNICHLLVKSGSDDKSVGFISPSLALHQLLSLSWAWPSHLIMVMIKLTITSEFRTIFKSENMLCSPAEWFSMKMVNHENMLSEALAYLGQNIKDLAHSHIKLRIIIFSNEAQGKILLTPTPWLPAHESCR